MILTKIIASVLALSYVGGCVMVHRRYRVYQPGILKTMLITAALPFMAAATGVVSAVCLLKDLPSRLKKKG